MPPDVEAADRADAKQTRARGDLAHAVVDGPHGVEAVELSHVRDDALTLKALHGEAFWCTTEAGGCGGALILAAGPIRVPHFRHHTGAKCALAGDSARAARSYAHLQYQRALQSWLDKQGLNASIEHHLGADGRADLHVVVESQHHTIEVQLSPTGISEWSRRDEGYRRQVNHVTWLYGAGAEPAAAAAVANRGHALLLGPSSEAPAVVAVGVRTSLAEAWSPLDECELRAERLWTPDLDQALADVEAAQQKAAERAAGEARQQELREAARAARRRAAEARNDERVTKEAAPAEGGERYGTVRWWRGILPELDEWTPAQGWRWTEELTREGQSVASVAAYLVTRIYASGPVRSLMLLDEVVGAEVLESLERAGFVRQHERGGVRRWERHAADAQ